MQSFLRISFLFLFLSPVLNGQDLVINEIMADNDITLMDEFGDYPDWIELYNAGGTAVNAGEYFLSDDPLEPGEWQIPDTLIQPGGFLLVFASGRDTLFHAGFKISSSGERLFLYNADSILLQATDSVPLKGDQSWGRELDGSDQWKVFHLPSPGTTNNLGNALSLSHDRGFYTSPFSLAISSERDMEIRYTLDGSDPTPADLLYEAPLFIDGREGDPNILSLIPSTQPPPVEVMVPWSPPAAPSKKATVLKCRSFKDGLATSPVYSATYFVDPLGADRYTLPVFSLICDSLDLFDYDSGIYVPGVHADPNNNRTGNYFERGIEWEQPVHIEYFEKNGDVALAQDGGLRIHGQYSRRAAQKSLRLYARDEYGKKYFEYPMFPKADLDEYKRLVLRSSMTTFDTRWSDAFISDLMRDLDYEIQDFQPVIVFLNGEYWGLHNMREYLDEYYINGHYPEVDKDSINLLSMKWTANEGTNSGYYNLYQFIEANSLAEEANFEYVASQIDTSNYLDYILTEMYMANRDWPGNNFTRWQSQEEGSKWRWILNDLDASFRFPDLDMIAQSTDSLSTKWPNPQWSTLLPRKMLENPVFRERFICRSLELMQDEFHPDRIVDAIGAYSDRLVPEIEEHIRRWNFPESREDWLSFYDSTMVRFAATRPVYYMEHLEKYFGMNQQELAELCDCFDPGEGLEVAISKPVHKSVVSHPFDLAAEAVVLKGGSDIQMSLFLDGKYLGVQDRAPYSWGPEADSLLAGLEMGQHWLEVLAFDVSTLATTRTWSTFYVIMDTPGDEFTLGDTATTEGIADVFTSNMVINESDTFTNMSMDTLFLRVHNFSFMAQAAADPVTPFLVRVNGEDDFTVLAIGDTRENSAYEVGANNLPFREEKDTVIALAPGETLATGFLDAYPSGYFGGQGSVIPFDEKEPADEIWYTGASKSTLSGSVVEGQPPIYDVPPRTTYRRNYHYHISFSITDTLGIREITVSDEEVLYPELSIYPNPVSEGAVYIQPGNCSGAVVLTISDMQGRIIHRIETEDSPVAISTDVLGEAGTYVVRMESMQGVAYGKIVKTRY